MVFMVDSAPLLPNNNYHTAGYVLVADDRLWNRIAVRDLLESAGHRVVEAENGLQVLELVVAESPDLLLLDILDAEIGRF